MDPQFAANLSRLGQVTVDNPVTTPRTVSIATASAADVAELFRTLIWRGCYAQENCRNDKRRRAGPLITAFARVNWQSLCTSIDQV